mgnify:CR=1 FL=1
MDGTGIYQLSGRGVKSVADYDMEAANLDAAKQQKELRAMQILTGQNALDQQQQQVANARERGKQTRPTTSVSAR